MDLMEELEDMLDNGTTMIIGRNPGLEILVNYLSEIAYKQPLLLLLRAHVVGRGRHSSRRL